MNKTDSKAKLFNIIISSRNLQDVLDACSALLGNPLVFANPSLQLMGRSTSCAEYPEIFDWFSFHMDQRHLDVAREAAEAGYFKAIYESDQPVPGRISVVDTNWLAARVRQRDHVLGNILVADCHTPFTEEHRELLPSVCQTIAFFLQNYGDRGYGSQNYGPLLVELMAGDHLSDSVPGSLRSTFRLLGHDLPRQLRLLVLRPQIATDTLSRTIQDSRIAHHFPESLSVIYKNDCVRVLDGAIPMHELKERLQSALSQEQIRCGISRVFEDPLEMREAYLQADAAIRLAPDSQGSVPVFFDEVAGRYVLEQAVAANTLSVNGLVMGEVRLLEEADRREGSQRLTDLATFLSCGRNITRAAELRYVHKNSMYYRLDRIEEMTGLDLKDDATCVGVTLSLTLLGYLPLRET